jgi:hypothetical protein
VPPTLVSSGEEDNDNEKADEDANADDAPCERADSDSDSDANSSVSSSSCDDQTMLAGATDPLDGRRCHYEARPHLCLCVTTRLLFMSVAYYVLLLVAASMCVTSVRTSVGSSRKL